MPVTGVAWLSSARVVRCLVSSFNERNPLEKLFGILVQVPSFFQTASDILEEGGDDVKSSWPLWTGLHTCYNGRYNGRQWCESERILKPYLSPDCSLQLESMKLESLVIVDQHATVNLYLGLVLPARHALEVQEVQKLWIYVFTLKSFDFSTKNLLLSRTLRKSLRLLK